MIELWPLIFIWIGIGLLPIKEWIKISLDIIILAIGVVFLLSPTNFNRFTGCDETTKVDLSVTDIFVIPMDTNRIMTACWKQIWGRASFRLFPTQISLPSMEFPLNTLKTNSLFPVPMPKLN